MVWIMFWVKSKDIRTMSTSTDSLVDFEQVNVSWDVTKRYKTLQNIFKMLCIKCCPHPSNFYWHNPLKYTLFLNKNAGDTFTYYILKKFNQLWNKVVQLETSKTKRGKSKTLYIFFFSLKFVKMEKFYFTILALK